MTDTGPTPDDPTASPEVPWPAAGDTLPAAQADPSADPTPPRRPRPTGPVQYKGDDLEPERGPGLGCFRIQLVVLVALIVLTPLSVVWQWPPMVSAALLFIVIFLLLITGQTIIFLLRLVAADRRGRRRPLASGTRTVGELEDSAGEAESSESVEPAAESVEPAAESVEPAAEAVAAESDPDRPADPVAPSAGLTDTHPGTDSQPPTA